MLKLYFYNVIRFRCEYNNVSNYLLRTVFLHAVKILWNISFIYYSIIIVLDIIPWVRNVCVGGVCECGCLWVGMFVSVGGGEGVCG